MAAPIKRDIKGRIVKGTGGRPQGAKNHLTTTVKEKVLSVFNDLQSDKKANLKAFAKKYPRDFYQIAAKLIPTEIAGTIEIPQPFSDNQVNKIIAELRQKSNEAA